VLEFECRDVGSAYNFIVCVHLAPYAVCLRIPHLDLQKVFGWAIDFIKRLRFELGQPLVEATRHSW